MYSEDKIKLKCIENLELLIQSIKNDTTGFNYSYNEELLKLETTPEGVIRHVSYKVERTEFVPNPKK